MLSMMKNLFSWSSELLKKLEMLDKVHNDAIRKIEKVTLLVPGEISLHTVSKIYCLKQQLPSVIYLDNRKNFVSIHWALLRYKLAIHQYNNFHTENTILIQLPFSTMIERVMGTSHANGKEILRKVLGRAFFSYEELAQYYVIVSRW